MNNSIWKLLTKKLDLVFTPSTVAKLTYIRRADIDDQLTKHLVMPGRQLVIYGHSGSGKTTLLNNTIKQLEGKCITSSCIKSTTISELILDAFDKLGPYFTSSKVENATSSIASDMSLKYNEIGYTIKQSLSVSSTTTQQRVLPVQLTPQRLADFLGTANCMWIIEDFHKVEKTEKNQLAQILKVFMDMAEKYPKLKIVCIGAVGTARELIEYDSELSNRIAEIHVPLMEDKELLQIIRKGSKLLNITIEEKIESQQPPAKQVA